MEPIADEKSFNRSLKVISSILIKPEVELFCFDPGYKLAIDLCKDLYNQIVSARFQLIMGYKKLHDPEYFNWKFDDYGQNWLRFQYLKSAINNYNSAFDILCQTLWFGFDLYRVIESNKPKRTIQKIESESELKVLFRKCKWTNLHNALKKEGSENGKELLNRLESFRHSQAGKNIRDWAKTIKHHGKFNARELYRANSALIYGKFNSQYARPLTLSLDEIAEVLKEYHIQFYTLCKYIVDFFNFDTSITVTSDGELILHSKHPSEFKKIYIPIKDF